MPKRSNPFQNLIFQIEKAVADQGWTVTESGEIIENGYVREVDILIEGSVNGHPIKIYIECRNHGRPQNIEWIDALIGKYQNLRPLIAVSKSGFTRPACEKADINGIRLLTLKEAINEPWAKRIHISQHSIDVEVKSFSFQVKGVSGEIKLDRESIFSSIDGRTKLPIEEYIFFRLHKDAAEIQKRADEWISSYAHSDHKSGKIPVNLVLFPTDSVLYISEIEKYEVSEIKVFLEVNWQTIDTDQEYFEYDSSKIILTNSQKDKSKMKFVIRKKIDGDEIVAQVEDGEFQFLVKLDTNLE